MIWVRFLRTNRFLFILPNLRKDKGNLKIKEACIFWWWKMPNYPERVGADTTPNSSFRSWVVQHFIKHGQANHFTTKLVWVGIIFLLNWNSTHYIPFPRTLCFVQNYLRGKRKLSSSPYHTPSIWPLLIDDNAIF